ncbi:hypothetical protein Hanom_Chr06g00512761 [Helianthus anomalus]
MRTYHDHDYGKDLYRLRLASIMFLSRKEASLSSIKCRRKFAINRLDSLSISSSSGKLLDLCKVKKLLEFCSSGEKSGEGVM